MNAIILILKDEKPKLVNVAKGRNTLSMVQPDGSEIELEIMTAIVTSLAGETSSYLIATNIEDLDIAQVHSAVETLFG